MGLISPGSGVRVPPGARQYIFFFFGKKKSRNKKKKYGNVWSIGVSIPVPRACKARTLPIELMPQKDGRAPAGN